jgi:hypothetical protein
MYYGSHSKCVEIEMFKRITCTIYLVWSVGIIVYLIFKCCFSKAGSKKLQTVDEKYVEIEL